MIYYLCKEKCFFKKKTCTHGKKIVPLQPNFKFDN